MSRNCNYCCNNCEGEFISPEYNCCCENKPKFSGAFIVDDEYIYIKKVIYNDPYTIVLWSDGRKTTSKKMDGDVFNKELGLSLAILKKLAGHDQVAKLLDDWAPEKANIIDLKMIRAKEKLAKKIEEKKVQDQLINDAKMVKNNDKKVVVKEAEKEQQN